LEAQVLAELCRSDVGVLSTGGGSVLRPENRAHLRQYAQVFYLRTTPEELFRRLRHDQNRPLLQVGDPLGRLRELFAARDPLYREAAHHVIETQRPKIGTMLHMILTQLERMDPQHDAAPNAQPT
jgi:shikimate kinase